MATSPSTTVDDCGRSPSKDSPCKLKFNCKHGLSCDYQHTEEEKSFFQKNGGKGNPSRKTKPCEPYRNCQKKKEDCDYAHGEEDAWCLKCKSSGHFKNDCNLNSRPKPQLTAQKERQQQTVQQPHKEVTEQNLETQQAIEQQQSDDQDYLKDAITFSSEKLVYICCNEQVLQKSSVFIRVDESKFPNRTPTLDWCKKVETITKQPSFKFFWVKVHDELETNTLCLVFTPGSDINELMSLIKDNIDDLFIVSSPKNFHAYKNCAEPCRYKFNCMYGLTCDFQHTREERELYEKNGGKGNPNRKTRPCEHYPKCREKKEDCIYAHGEDDAWCLNCTSSGHFTDNCQKEASELRQQFQETKHQQDQEKKPEMAPKHQDLQHRNEPNAYREDIAYKVMTETDIASKIDSCGIELSILADKLCTHKIVNAKQVKSITDDSNGQTNEARMKRLLQKVTDTVREDGETFGYFLQILREEDTRLATKFAKDMEEKYKEYSQ